MNETTNPLKIDENLIFFNKALEYVDMGNNFDVISSSNNSAHDNEENSNLLKDQMLSELDNLKELILNNPDVKLQSLNEEDKQTYDKFIKFYSACPICGNANHYSYLKRFYFDNEKTLLKNLLINLMGFKSKKLRKYNINFGVSCCSCFKHYFLEEY